MRELRQEEAVQAYLESDGKSILNCCPRFGKIWCALEIVKRLNINHIWILAPRKDIFQGWEDDMKKFGGPSVVGMTTFTSIKKLKLDGPQPQFLIIDEPHEASRAQQKALKPFVDKYPTLGLTGTMTQKTRTELYNSLNLDVCYKYTIEQGVEEGILADYQIFIHKVDLDDSRQIYSTKKRKYTEKGYFKMYEYIMDQAEPRERWFMELKLISILQNSLTKMEKTRKLINEDKEKRVLVFCGTTNIADKLGIPVYHSKANEKEVFNNFCKGVEINQLATIKMMQAGITVNPISMGIINYMSGSPEESAQKICRFLGLEYDNPGKKAEIHIISSTEDFEQWRMATGLQFFDKEKIKFI